MPDHGENVLLVTISDILRTNTNHAHTKELHGLHSQITVVVAVEHVLRSHVRLAPVDAGIVNAMTNAKDDKTISHLLIQVFNEAVLNLHGIDPETEGTLFTTSLDVIIDEASSLELLLS